MVGVHGNKGGNLPLEGLLGCEQLGLNHRLKHVSQLVHLHLVKRNRGGVGRLKRHVFNHLNLLEGGRQGCRFGGGNPCHSQWGHACGSQWGLQIGNQTTCG